MRVDEIGVGVMPAEILQRLAVAHRARREAERGTFDPTYLVYSIGKLMLLKLRNEYQQEQGKAFSLRTFHDTLLAQGNAPIWLHRKLMLANDNGEVLE